MFPLIATFVLAGLLVYYLLFRDTHPKGFPKGPRGLPFLGYLPFLGKTPHIKYGELAKKYGPVFSLDFGSYPVVILNDFASIKEAMVHMDYHGRPDLLPLLARGEGEKVGMALNEGKEWEEQRRFMLKNLRDLGFGKTRIEPVIMEEVEDFLQHMKQHVGKPLKFERLFNTYILNTLWRILTGDKVDKEDARFQYIMKTVIEGIIQTEMVGPCYFLPWLARFFPNWSGFNRYLSSVPPTRNLMKEIVEQHKETFSESDMPRDFVDVYIRQIRKETDTTSSFYADRGFKNLTYVLMDLFSAGSETTSAALGWSLLYLTHHPDVKRKLLDEIDRVTEGVSRPLTLEDRKRMPYTEAVMWETLRKGTISLGFMSKTMVDSKFRDFNFPKGTILLPNLWAANYDKEYWGDPEAFRPERFLNERGEFVKREHALPFGIGRRNCPGESLAMLEYFLFLVNILQNFDFEFEKGKEPPTMEPLMGIALTPQVFELVVIDRLNETKG